MKPDQINLPCDEVLVQSTRWLRAGRKVALATVIATWGSSPRLVGSQLAVDDQGLMSGSVSGGCIESALVGEAMAVMEHGQSRQLTFGVSDETAWEVGLACGGKIEVYLERLSDLDLLECLLQLRAEKVPVAWVHHLTTSCWTLVSERLIYGQTSLSKPVLLEVRKLLADRHSALIGEELFVHSLLPPLRLIVVGAVHIAQALVPMAKLAGYETTIIDPRSSFASLERFPEVRLIHRWPDEALREFQLDCRSAVVVLTHDPKLDDPALIEALRHQPFYLGALGSRTTHAHRLERLRGEGFSQSTLTRIHAPIGLPIGARQPAEIAIAIMAEIIATLRHQYLRSQLSKA